MITTFELTNCTDKELTAMFAMASRALVQTNRVTPERRNLLASLENISRVRAGRHCQVKQPGF